MTDDVSRVTAPCARRVVEGEEVDMGRFCVEAVFPAVVEVECFAVDEGESVVFGALGDEETAGLCCVWMRVLTTSSGVVITPAMPPAVAAVIISNGKPMLFEPIYCFASPRSSS